MNPITIAHALPLRTVTFLSTLIGLPLAIVTTILTQQYERESFNYGHYWSHRRHRTRATALCFPYLGLTVTMALCIASFRRLRAMGKQLPVKTAWADALAAVLYLAVLLPIWIREVGREIRAPGLVLLISYTTVPMIINMFVFPSLSSSFPRLPHQSANADQVPPRLHLFPQPARHPACLLLSILALLCAPPLPQLPGFLPRQHGHDASPPRDGD
jgi:hypothetical protein